MHHEHGFGTIPRPRLRRVFQLGGALALAAFCVAPALGYFARVHVNDASPGIQIWQTFGEGFEPGTEWRNSGTIDVSAGDLTSPPGLNYAVTQPPRAAQALQGTHGSPRMNQRPLAAPVGAEPTQITFLVQPVSAASHGGVVLNSPHLHDPTDQFDAQFVGVVSGDDLEIDTAPGDADDVIVPNVFAIGQTSLVVIRIEYGVRPAPGEDRIAVWVDQDVENLTPANAAAELFFSNTVDQIATLGTASWDDADGGAREGAVVDDVILEAAPSSSAATGYAFPTLFWPSHADQFADPAQPVRYDVQIASDPSFATLVDEDAVALPRYVHDRPFPPGTYYWRTRSITHDGQVSDWTAAETFTIAAADEVVTVDYDPVLFDHSAAVLAAVNQAEALAHQAKSVELVFPAGDYAFPPSFSGALICLDNVSGVSVKGDGARLNFSTRKQTLLNAANCAHIAISGFEISYALGALRIQGYVTAVDQGARQATLAIEPGFPDFTASDSPAGDIFILLDPNVDGRIKDGSSNFYRMDSWAQNPDQTWTVDVVDGDFTDWEAGDRFVFHFRNGSPVLTTCNDCQAVTYYGLNIGGWGNMGFQSVPGSLVNILHCTTFMEDGKWMMGNADGVHFRGHPVGPWIEGAEIQALGDDGVALYARPASMSSAKPDGEPNAAVCIEEHFNLEPGDEVAFFEPLLGTILLETTVQSAQPQVDGGYLVHFADPLPDGMTFSGNLVDKTQIWNRSKSCGDFVIRNCKFTNIRRYGTVFRAKGGVVADNEYRGVSNRSVAFSNGTMWPNGLYASEIIVRDNLIVDGGFEAGGALPAISFRFNGHGTAAQSVGPRNLLIERNMAVDCPTPAIELVNAADVVIRHNWKPLGGGGFDALDYAAERCEDIAFEEFNDGGAPPDAPTGLTAAADDDAVRLEWSTSGAADVVSYVVYRGANPGGPYAPLASVLFVAQYRDEAVVVGAPYYYVVAAVDADGNESPSSAEARGGLYICVGDLDGDGQTTSADCQVMLNTWGTPRSAGDLNDDGAVDLWDMGVLQRDCGCQ